MIIKKELENGLVQVSSTDGLVDIGEGGAEAIICTPAEVEYITEVKRE